LPPLISGLDLANLNDQFKPIPDRMIKITKIKKEVREKTMQASSPLYCTTTSSRQVVLPQAIKALASFLIGLWLTLV
jgi:hypothetical protein